MQTRNSAESESGRFTTRSMWGVAVLCVLQIWYLVLEFYRHWPAMSITARTLSVLYGLSSAVAAFGKERTQSVLGCDYRVLPIRGWGAFDIPNLSLKSIG